MFAGAYCGNGTDPGDKRGAQWSAHVDPWRSPRRDGAGCRPSVGRKLLHTFGRDRLVTDHHQQDEDRRNRHSKLSNAEHSIPICFEQHKTDRFMKSCVYCRCTKSVLFFFTVQNWKRRSCWNEGRTENHHSEWRWPHWSWQGETSIRTFWNPNLNKNEFHYLFDEPLMK